MLSPLRNRFGIPGVISVIALVFAMLGGAYAASDNSGSGDATTSAKGKKGPRGPKGPKGDTGPAGPAGPAGSAGAKGDTGAAGSNGAKGDKGDKGDKGANGTNGKSVEVGTPTVGECDKGGATVQVAGEASTKKAVCNGQTGFTKTLPPGETETGVWSISQTETLGVPFYASISFPIPLEEGGTETPQSGFFFNQEKTELGDFGTSGCTGSVGEPTAPPGKLCVYTQFEETEHVLPLHEAKAPDFVFGAYGASGALLHAATADPTVTEPAKYSGWGSWAVTAPTP